MASFCKQCSIETFGKDFEDFARISTQLQTEENLYPLVLCEGCGPTQVDHTGTCIVKDCALKHGEPK